MTFSLGLATEMIKARTSMLNFFDLKLTSTGFSSVAAQKAAKKAGHFCDFSIRLAILKIYILIPIIQ